MNKSYSEIILEYVGCQRQSGSHDCGIFVIVLVTTLCFGNKPVPRAGWYEICQSRYSIIENITVQIHARYGLYF